MSILKSTHSGAKYIQFQERLDKFTKFALYANKQYYKGTFDTTTISFYLPLRKLKPEDLANDFRNTRVVHMDDGSFIEYVETIHSYSYEWTEEQFKKDFIEHVKNLITKLEKPFEIEDICFPLRYLNFNDIIKK